MATTRTRGETLGRDLLVGAASGVLASAVTGLTDGVLDRAVSEEQKVRASAVREGSGHEVAPRRIAERIAGGEPSATVSAAARIGFAAAFGIGWGLIYASLRRKVPGLSRAGGLPFAVPFFAVCDGAIAPLLGLSAPLQVTPWQLNAKELGNHIAWTATAELANRAAGALVRG